MAAQYIRSSETIPPRTAYKQASVTRRPNRIYNGYEYCRDNNAVSYTIQLQRATMLASTPSGSLRMPCEVCILRMLRAPRGLRMAYAPFRLHMIRFFLRVGFHRTLQSRERHLFAGTVLPCTTRSTCTSVQRAPISPNVARQAVRQPSTRSMKSRPRLSTMSLRVSGRSCHRRYAREARTLSCKPLHLAGRAAHTYHRDPLQGREWPHRAC